MKGRRLGKLTGEIDRRPGYGNRLRAEKFKDRIFSDMGAKM
jgi:hypothetical protein